MSYELVQLFPDVFHGIDNVLVKLFVELFLSLFGHVGC